MDGPSPRTAGPLGRAVETRTVPAGGISLRALPDETGAPVATVVAGREVIVLGRRGAWVHVDAGDGVDGWVTGAALAGVAVGASATAATGGPAAEVTAASVEPASKAVVEKQRSPLRIGTGPVVGALGGIVAIVGAVLPWQQTVADRVEIDAFDVPVAFLASWEHLAEGGVSLGVVLLVLGAVGTVVSLVAGGGIVRRILGFGIVMLCVVYVLQQQDFLTSSELGLGTGLNVWDVADYGVAVSFAGGIVMTFAPSR